MRPNHNHHIQQVTPKDVEALFSSKANELHAKVDATRDAYLGFIFPITRADLDSVAAAVDLPADAARAIFSAGTRFSSFKIVGRGGSITNHITGAALLAARGKSLDTGLEIVNDTSLKKLVRENETAIISIADARSSWFGRIFFPAEAFANAIQVFGGKVSPGAVFDVAAEYGFAATAGTRKTVRGDFGIATWLTLLARAP